MGKGEDGEKGRERGRKRVELVVCGCVSTCVGGRERERERKRERIFLLSCLPPQALCGSVYYGYFVPKMSLEVSYHFSARSKDELCYKFFVFKFKLILVGVSLI